MAQKTQLEQWKAKRKEGGKITLPTGTQVRIEVPDLVELLAQGHVPNPLVKFALEATESLQTGLDVDMDKIKEAAEFMRWVVAVTVKDPEIEPSDVPEIDAMDTAMVLEFAMRQRQVDAVGHQLHGLEKIQDWRRFHLG